MKSTSIKMFVRDVGVRDCSPGMLLGKLVHDFFTSLILLLRVWSDLEINDEIVILQSED